MDYAKESLKMHYDLKGKIEVVSRAKVDSKDALSLAYTPGVAQPCLEIQKDVNKSYDLTRRWNTVAVVTDGTAVLGLGDIGPEAGMPVMEGKCVLFKEFGGVDAIPLCVRSKDVDEIVKTVSLLAGSFGGINLEDISAPRCFEIEKKLKECCDIPIFHDDQHGTAVITLRASGMSAKKVKVYVRKPVTSIKLTSKSSLKLGKGKTSQIKTKVYPGEKQMVNAKLYYKSSNTKVATVSSTGKITAKSGGYAKITVSTSKSAGKVCTKYVDVFIYDGFNDVCMETSGNKTIYTFNPSWKSVTIKFTSNGKTYSFKTSDLGSDVKQAFNTLTSFAGFKITKYGVKVMKDANKGKNIVNFRIVKTGENYDVLVDNTRYQLTFYKKIKGKVSFTVEK